MERRRQVATSVEEAGSAQVEGKSRQERNWSESLLILWNQRGLVTCEIGHMMQRASRLSGGKSAKAIREGQRNELSSWRREGTHSRRASPT